MEELYRGFKENIAGKYPISKNLWGLVPFGLIILVGSGQVRWEYFEEKINILISQVFLILGIIPIFLFFIVIVLETIGWIVPSLSPIIESIIRIILLTISPLRKIYRYVIKLLILGSINEILEEKEKGQPIKFIFQGDPHADHYFIKTLNFNKEKLYVEKIHPDQNTNYWRMGIKFSKTNIFTSLRTSINYPLLHFTKDNNSNNLCLTYYDETGRVVGDAYTVIVNDYDKTKNLSLYAKKKGKKVEVEIYYEKVFVKKQNISQDFLFGKLFAWGDSQPYSIESDLKIN